MARLIGAHVETKPPQSIGAVTCLLADGRELPVSDVLAAWNTQTPAALVTFYRAQLVAGDTAPIRSLMGALEAQGLAPLSIAVTSLKDATAAPTLALCSRM